MTITSKTIKILWAAAAGRCSFPGCAERLCSHEGKGISPYTIGEMAHICGERPGSNRHNPAQSESDRDDYTNLILLCPTHHTLIDKKENEIQFPAEMIHKIKSSHEMEILKILDSKNNYSENDIAKEIFILLTENRESWSRYGPRSDIARKEPNNEKIYAMWVSERLSVIVPHNRQIASILNHNRNIFKTTNQEAISSFLIHARSYERWICDEIPYSAVVRFPAEFEIMIKEVANAGA